MRIRKIFTKLFNSNRCTNSKSTKSTPKKNYSEIYRRYPSIFSENNKFKTIEEKENFADWCEAVEFMAQNRKDFTIVC